MSRSLARGSARTLTALAATFLVLLPMQAASAAAPKKPATKQLAPNASIASCSWDRPGVNPYMGELPAAVDRYTNISADVRAKLKDRIAKQQYDDMVVIKRDGISSQSDKFSYGAQIRDMHFGDKGRVCTSVTRTRWKPTTTERGLVYCEAGECVLVPTVCRNVSRVSRKPSAVANDGTQANKPVAVAPDGFAAKPEDPSEAGGSAIPAPTVVAGGTPAFSDVAAGPVFPLPGGPTGSSSITVVTPPSGGGGSGGSTDPGAGGSTGGGGTVIPGGGGSTGGGSTGGGSTGGGSTSGGATGGGSTGGGSGTTPSGGGTAPPSGPVGGETVISPIPEPSTYALMIIGGLVLWAQARRRSQSSRAAKAAR